MGASESLHAKSQCQPGDQITTVSERVEDVDPILQRVHALRITEPLLKSPLQSETSLTDILVRKPSSSASPIPGSLNPKVLLELFSLYREWQEQKAGKISQKQEEIENKIETVDALAVKLLQRFSHSASAMRTTAHNLAEIHQLQVEVGELKGRLTEVISNCNAICKRIATEGPPSIQSSVTPFQASEMKPSNFKNLLSHD